MKTAIACAVLCLTAVVHAGVQEGIAAMEQGDYPTARKEFSRLAERGDDNAMVTLGLMYHQGEGVQQDYDKAMDWYLKAFKKGNGDAYSNIGVMYRDGLGVKKNKNMAYCLFLITHVCSLGGESTQLRANSCLRRMVPEMTKEELAECFNFTHEYVKAYVTSKGTLEGIPAKYAPRKGQPALKDEPWWMEGELDFLNAKQPDKNSRAARSHPKPGSAQQTSVPAQRHTLRYQLKPPRGAPPDGVRLDLVSDNGCISGTGLSRCRVTTNGQEVVYEDTASVAWGLPRFIAVQPKDSVSQVFELALPREPKPADWTPWRKPDFVESDRMAIFGLCSGEATGSRNKSIPSQPFELRYCIEKATDGPAGEAKGAGR